MNELFTLSVINEILNQLVLSLELNQGFSILTHSLVAIITVVIYSTIGKEMNYRAERHFLLFNLILHFLTIIFFSFCFKIGIKITEVNTI